MSTLDTKNFESNAQLQKLDEQVEAPSQELLDKSRVCLIRHAVTDFNVVLQPIVKQHGTESQEFRELRSRRDLIDPPLNELGLS